MTVRQSSSRERLNTMPNKYVNIQDLNYIDKQLTIAILIYLLLGTAKHQQS